MTNRRSVLVRTHFRALFLYLTVILVVMALLAPAGFAQTEVTPAAPAISWQAPMAFAVLDNPNDNGHGVLLSWELSPDDAELLFYEIWRAPATDAPQGEWFQIGSVPRGTTEYIYIDEDATSLGEPNPEFVAIGEPVHLSLRGMSADGSVSAWTPVVTGTGKGNWFHTGKVNVLVATIGFTLAVVYFINSAKSGKKLFIREIPGLGAVDEAIGRATEMGKPILFVLGTGTASDIATIAGYTVLSRVAKRTAEYQTPIMVPVNDPIMLAMGQEVVKDAYTAAGRPDVYKPENISYVSAMQFPYVAAVNGIMRREKPATCFYMGVFHAESLLLAETGSMTGSVQISGTDQLAQIPFFVAATDYTLIGEELYAASAYLSQEPSQLGPLKAQDYTKVLIIIIIIAGILSLTLFQWDGILRMVQTPA